MTKALEEVKKLFDSAPPRPNAKRVVVVIVDKVSVYLKPNSLSGSLTDGQHKIWKSLVIARLRATM